jgi:hypothetical protein
MIKDDITKDNILKKHVISSSILLNDKGINTLISVIDTCKEAHYINETLNHMIKYFDGVKGVSTSFEVGAYKDEDYKPNNIILYGIKKSYFQERHIYKIILLTEKLDYFDLMVDKFKLEFALNYIDDIIKYNLVKSLYFLSVSAFDLGSFMFVSVSTIFFFTSASTFTAKASLYFLIALA